MKQGTLTFKPVLVARGVVKFHLAITVPGRKPARKSITWMPTRLLTAQEVERLGYDPARMIAQFERDRLHGNFCLHCCEFCGGVWGVDRTRDYRDAYSDKDNPPWVYCCGRCYAKVLQAPWAASPYALYGKGLRWADMKDGRSPWADRNRM